MAMQLAQRAHQGIKFAQSLSARWNQREQQAFAVELFEVEGLLVEQRGRGASDGLVRGFVHRFFAGGQLDRNGVERYQRWCRQQRQDRRRGRPLRLSP